MCPKHRYTAVEIYVLGWFAIEIFFLLLLAKESLTGCSWFVWLLRFLICYRLFDIFQSWVSQFVLMPDWKPINPYRSLVLVFIGYIEIIISYALIAFVFGSTFSKPFLSVFQALYYSFTTAITMGSAWKPEGAGGYAIFYTQIMFILLFITAVIQRILGRLGEEAQAAKNKGIWRKE